MVVSTPALGLSCYLESRAIRFNQIAIMLELYNDQDHNSTFRYQFSPSHENLPKDIQMSQSRENPMTVEEMRTQFKDLENEGLFCMLQKHCDENIEWMITRPDDGEMGKTIASAGEPTSPDPFCHTLTASRRDG